MAVIDTYKTINSQGKALFKDKGSKFFSFVSPVASVEEVADQLAKIKEEHPKARHYCTAFRIGNNGELFRSNDDGEPSGSAGKPMLNALQSSELTFVLAVVVRYFGGTLLGVSGLINAYKTAVEMAVDDSIIVNKTIDKEFTLKFDFEDMGAVMYQLKAHNITVLKQDFDQVNILSCKARLTKIPKLQEALQHLYKVEFLL